MDGPLRDLLGELERTTTGPVAERVLASRDGLAWFASCQAGFALRYDLRGPGDFLALDQVGVESILSAEDNKDVLVRSLLRLLLLAQAGLAQLSVPFPATRADIEELLDLCSVLPEAWWPLLERGARALEGRLDGDGEALLRKGYRMLSQVGKGGMGRVVRGLQQSTGNWVALKVIELSSSLQADRTRAEIRNLSLLEHPGIPRLLDVAEFWNAGRRCQALVLELVEGHSILELQMLRQRPRDLVRHFLGACEAVQHAHGKKLVHRDLHPGNILIDSQERLHVIDFGISMMLEDSSASPGSLAAGTAAYSPPEQLAGQLEGLGCEADVYSLGAVLYRLLAGHPAFEKIQQGMSREQILGRRARTLRESRPDLPRDLQLVVAKAMASEPEDRYATAGELGDDLQRFLDYVPVRARRWSPWAHLQGMFMRQPAHLAVAVLAVLFGLAVWTTTHFAASSTRASLAGPRSRLESLREEAERLGSWERVERGLNVIERELLELDDDSPLVQELQWEVQELRGNRLREQRQYAELEELRSRCVEFWRDLVERAPTRERQANLVRNLVLWGDALGYLKRTPKKIQLYEQARDLNAELARQPGGEPWVNDWFWSEYRLAREAYLAGRFDRSWEYLGKAGEVLERLEELEPGEARTLHCACEMLGLQIDLTEGAAERGRLYATWTELCTELRYKDTFRLSYMQLYHRALRDFRDHLLMHDPRDPRIEGLGDRITDLNRSWGEMRNQPR